MTDFTFMNHGSITVLTPRSTEAHNWIEMHLLEDLYDEVQFWCGGVVIEPRYVAPILEAIAGSGMTVEG